MSYINIQCYVRTQKHGNKIFFPFLFRCNCVCVNPKSPGLHIIIYRYKSVRGLRCLQEMRIHYYSLSWRIYWILGVGRYSGFIWKRRREGKSSKPNLFSALCIIILFEYCYPPVALWHFKLSGQLYTTSTTHAQRTKVQTLIHFEFTS